LLAPRRRRHFAAQPDTLKPTPQWRFRGGAAPGQVAVRLQNDLGVNLEVALALTLLDELELRRWPQQDLD
jgi:hypothetical protein